MKCAMCEGKRVIVRTEAEIRRSQGIDYRTGRQVERLYQCERCQGSGIDPQPPTPAGVGGEGVTLEAPGFTSESFAAALLRARARGTMPMIGAGNGVVLVESVRCGARYRVTRSECSCQGHHSHGHCLHRAAAIYAADVAGVNVCQSHVLGFNPAGHVVTAADRRHQLSEVA